MKRGVLDRHNKIIPRSQIAPSALSRNNYGTRAGAPSPYMVPIAGISAEITAPPPAACPRWRQGQHRGCGEDEGAALADQVGHAGLGCDPGGGVAWQAVVVNDGKVVHWEGVA